MEISAKETLDGYLRVARTLRDKLDGLITSAATDLGTQRKVLFDVSQEVDLVLANKAAHRYDEISVCTHSCCEHEQVLNPALWSTLPMELLQHVFAKLPIPNICRLKSLSKEWKSGLQSSSSEFTVALKESSPRMLARVSWGGLRNFGLHVLDERNNRWLEMHFSAFNRDVYTTNRRCVHMNGAADAGLVCYIRKDLESGFNCIYVINPMTGVVNRLPNLNLLACSKLTMMRIVVDRDTYHYKVIVVTHSLPGEAEINPVEAEVYDSEVQQWTKPNSSLGRIFGIAHFWRRDQDFWNPIELGPCAYDCRDGKYYDFGQDQQKWLGKEVISYTLMKDRLFVLLWKENDSLSFISEYCVPENATSWVKEVTHSCPQIYRQRNRLGLISRIHACSGFVFVFVFQAGRKWQESGWVYDLTTYEWRELPPLPWRSFNPSDYHFRDVMCELQWNIRP